MATPTRRNTVGGNLRRLRDTAGISRAALAHRSGVSEPTIARVELYGADVRLSTLEAFAAALGVTVSDLVDEEAVA